MTVVVKLILVPLVVTVVRSVVHIYTYLTLPLYYLLEKPWQRLRIAKQCRAHLVNKGRLSESAPAHLIGTHFLEYERFAEMPSHILDDCATLTEAFQATLTKFPLDQPSYAFRPILEEEIQYDSEGKPIRVDGKVLRKYKLGDYQWLTYGQVAEKIFQLGRGLVALGMQPHDRVIIYTETGLNFTIGMTGLSLFGGVTVTLFHTLNDKGLISGINQTGAKFILTSFELLDRVAGFIEQCPSVVHVIYYEGPKKEPTRSLPGNVKVWTYSQLYELGRTEPFCHLSPAPLPGGAVQLIMFTSGTSGPPKGVVTTGAQLREAVLACGQVTRDVISEGPSHTYIAYLPQAHILELTLEIFLTLCGAKIGFASPFTLSESSPGLVKGQKCDLQLLKPTVMPAVPLVLERMQKEIYLKLSQKTPFSRDIFNFLIDYKSYWTQKGYQTPIVTKLLCSKIRQQFGNRLHYMIVGGAPLAPKLQSLIRNSLDVTLVQGYGTTETAGAVVCMDFDDLSYGRVGTPLNGVRLRLADWSEGGYTIQDKPYPRGELLIGGKMVSPGYFQLDELTKEGFFDENGIHWFITGDIGQMVNGTVQIIDRKKDLVKLANGEFISLGKVEAILKSNTYVDNICVIASGILNGVVALVVPNKRALRELATSKCGLPESTSFRELCFNSALVDLIHDTLIATGFGQKLKSIELPSVISLCHREWSPDTGELTAAMKLKRPIIAQKHATDIERLFAELRQNPDKARVRRLKSGNV